MKSAGIFTTPENYENMYFLCVSKYDLCRLCLCDSKQLIDITGENTNLEFTVEETITDLLQTKVVKEVGLPWLVCSACLEKLRDFRLFKSRCLECKIAFESRIQQKDGSSSSNWENAKELPVKVEEIDHFETPKEVAPVGNDGEDFAEDIQKQEDYYESPLQYVSPASSEDSCFSSVECVYEDDIMANKKTEDDTTDEFFNEEMESTEVDPLVGPTSENDTITGDDSTIGPCPHLNKSKKMTHSQQQILTVVENERKNLVCDRCHRNVSGKGALASHMLHHCRENSLRKENTCEETSRLGRNSETVTVDQKGNPMKRRWTHLRTLPRSSDKPKVVKDKKKIFQCKLCRKWYSTPSDLERHIRTHTGERPYCCGICDARFADRANLRKHLMIHKGVKPFSCSVCNKGFFRNTHLRTHLRVHTGEKPFHCVECGKQFSRGDLLKKHCKAHHQMS